MSSRTELVGWVNDLLQISYTKIEQLGGGGAFCQIIDSIYGACARAGLSGSHFVHDGCLPDKVAKFAHAGDVPMTRVKMNAKHEYEYIANFKSTLR